MDAWRRTQGRPLRGQPWLMGVTPFGVGKSVSSFAGVVVVPVSSARRVFSRRGEDASGAGGTDAARLEPRPPGRLLNLGG